MRLRFVLPVHGSVRPRAPGLIGLFVVALACQSRERAGADSTVDIAGDTTPNASASAKSSPYSLAQFAQLRWLEGRWRGALPDGGFFYEQYRWTDDSTIVMHAFADSAFARATDSARVSLRNGVVANEGLTARWVATRLDSAAVEFVPRRGASNGFSWVRESPDRWTATLQSPSRDGGVRSTVYRMERTGRVAH